METLGSPFSIRIRVGSETPIRRAQDFSGSRRRLRAIARFSPSKRRCASTADGMESIAADRFDIKYILA